MTTSERMKLLMGQKCDARFDIVVSSELKKLVADRAAMDGINLTYWVKMAIVEKLERDNQL